MQNARFPMYITIVLNVLNIVLNLVLVIQFDLNVKGVAWGNAISSYIAIGYAMLLYKKNYYDKTLELNWDSILKKSELKKFYPLIRTFLCTLCLIFLLFLRKKICQPDIVTATEYHFITTMVYRVPME